MITMPDCQRVMKNVRDYFKAGHGAGNKTYDFTFPDQAGGPAEAVMPAQWSYERAIRRVIRRADSRGNRMHAAEPIDLSAFNRANTILAHYDTQPQHRSGNCGEMADLAALWAHRVDQHTDYYVAMLDPTKGDHSFCFAMPPGSKVKDTYISPLELVLEKSALMIDPWLNVACPAESYLRDVQEKLNKWTATGKQLKPVKSKVAPDGTLLSVKKKTATPLDWYITYFSRAPVRARKCF